MALRLIRFLFLSSPPYSDKPLKISSKIRRRRRRRRRRKKYKKKTQDQALSASKAQTHMHTVHRYIFTALEKAVAIQDTAKGLRETRIHVVCVYFLLQSTSTVFFFKGPILPFLFCVEAFERKIEEVFRGEARSFLSSCLRIYFSFTFLIPFAFFVHLFFFYCYDDDYTFIIIIVLLVINSHFSTFS